MFDTFSLIWFITYAHDWMPCCDYDYHCDWIPFPFNVVHNTIYDLCLVNEILHVMIMMMMLYVYIGILDGLTCCRLRSWWTLGKCTQGKGSCLNEDDYHILVPRKLGKWEKTL
jgi:hypothetical protein